MSNIWKPAFREGYFYITMFDKPVRVLHGTNDGKSGNDQPRIDFGNCFKDEESAYVAMHKIRNILLADAVGNRNPS